MENKLNIMKEKMPNVRKKKVDENKCLREKKVAFAKFVARLQLKK